MKGPRVTVLMTLYNKGPYVADAVRSVLASSFADLELLVIDDASTDEGPLHVRGFSDQRIRLISLPENLGRGGAANKGFDAARGEFVAILDADDEMLPDRLAKQVAFLDRNPAIGVCGTCARLMGDRSGVACWPIEDKEARGLLLFEDPVLYGSCMIRRTVLLDAAVRCPEAWRGPGMDYLFLLRLANVTKVANLQEALTKYRIGPNNFRHGKDLVEFTAPIARAALEHFGINATEAEVQAQLVLLRRAPLPASRNEVLGVKRWAMRLRRLNDSAGWFTRSVFSRKVESELDRLFYLLVDKGQGLWWPLLLRKGGRVQARLRYLVLRMVARRG